MLALLTLTLACATRGRGRLSADLPPPGPPQHVDGAIHQCGASAQPSTTAHASGGPTPRMIDIGVDAVKLAGDHLLVKASYGGGCGDHEFTLCFDRLPERRPAPVRVRLKDRTDDLCETSIRGWFVFDLVPLRQELIRTHGRQTGEILLQFSWGLAQWYAF
jgi:hypothetical protein